MYFPHPLLPVTSPSIVVSSIATNGALGSVAPQTGFSSNTWSAANTALFLPVRFSDLLSVSKLFWKNGTAVSGNVDVGIYTVDGRKIVSAGSTAQSGTSAIQSVSISTTEIGKGIYYLALVLDNTTGTVISSNSVNWQQIGGGCQMASAFPLPASATFAAIGTSQLPIIGATPRNFV